MPEETSEEKIEELEEPLKVEEPEPTVIPPESKIRVSNIEPDIFLETPRSTPVSDYQVVNKKYVDETTGTDTQTYTAGENLTIRDLCSIGHKTTINGTTILRDSYVDEANPDTNYGNQTYIRIQQNATSKFAKGIIWFDISTLPAASTIESVKLKFYVSAINNLGGANYVIIGSQRVTATWAEDTITWNNKPGARDDYGTSANVNATGWYEVDVTNLYKQWKDGTYTNYGIWLYGNTWSVTTLPAYVDITSKEGSATYRPYLYITYWGDTDKAYKADASSDAGVHLAGFATQTVNANASVLIQSSGSLGGFSGLTEDLIYYASDTPGAISTTSGTKEATVGKALSSSVLLISLWGIIEEHPYYKHIASENLRHSNDTERVKVSAGYIKIKEVKLGGNLKGCRIKFDLRTATYNFQVFAQIYKNGSPIGTERSTILDSYTTYSEDFSDFLKDDLIQIYVHYGGASVNAYVRNMRFYYDQELYKFGGHELSTHLPITTASMDIISITNQDPN